MKKKFNQRLTISASQLSSMEKDMMPKMGYKGNGPIGKIKEGILEPIQPPSQHAKDKSGLGYGQNDLEQKQEEVARRRQEEENEQRQEELSIKREEEVASKQQQEATCRQQKEEATHKQQEDTKVNEKKNEGAFYREGRSYSQSL
ncbi:uncharacterized protein LOC131876515 [Cryptomeria japonica]|uniref:uncharacterized protein LOC131876515 n=1 Tax=Cryptomeria japonica TaxID=3369 RepID=UPI0027D9DDB4|nr:uncharacterized protein LOC131876515 [Cryptomeria japonica]